MRVQDSTHPHQPANWTCCQQFPPLSAAINSAWDSCKPGLVSGPRKASGLGVSGISPCSGPCTPKEGSYVYVLMPALRYALATVLLRQWKTEQGPVWEKIFQRPLADFAPALQDYFDMMGNDSKFYHVVTETSLHREVPADFSSTLSVFL